MKKKLLILAVILLLIIMFFYFASPDRTYTPGWVKDIKNKVDASKCSPDNCEACNTVRCENYKDTCTINKTMYSCGNSCDAGLKYCVKKN
jgi:hypothetical protein